MAKRDLQAEQYALGVFGKKEGRMPNSSADWDKVHAIAYPGGLPDEFKSTVDASAAAAGVGDTPAAPTTPSLSTPTQSQFGTDPTRMDNARAALDEAQAKFSQMTGPNQAYNVLQEALKAKIGAPDQKIGESSISKAAGVSGYGALSSSLAGRATELRTEQAKLQNLATTLAGTYKDQYNAAMKEIDTAASLYEFEAQRFDAVESVAQQSLNQLKLLQAQADLDRDAEGRLTEFQRQQLAQSMVANGQATTVEEALQQIERGMSTPGNSTGVQGTASWEEWSKSIGSGTITSEPGSSIDYGNGEVGHHGFDIDGKIGDDITAPVSGKVTVKHDPNTYGNYAEIVDDQGNTWILGHMSEVDLQDGQYVSVGDHVGLMGNSGHVLKRNGGDGSHLHVEVRDPSGKQLNPSEIMTGATSGSSAPTETFDQFIAKKEQAAHQSFSPEMREAMRTEYNRTVGALQHAQQSKDAFETVVTQLGSVAAQKSARAHFNDLMSRGDTLGADSYLNSLAVQTLSGTLLNEYTQYNTTAAETGIALGALNQFKTAGGTLGLYKSALEKNKKWADVQKNQSWVDVVSQVNQAQAAYRNALYGASVTGGEKEAGAAFLVDDNDDVATVETKLKNMQAFASRWTQRTIDQQLGRPSDTESTSTEFNAEEARNRYGY